MFAIFTEEFLLCLGIKTATCNMGEHHGIVLRTIIDLVLHDTVEPKSSKDPCIGLW